MAFYFQGSGEQASIVLGIVGALQKSKEINFKNLTLKEKPLISLIFQKESLPPHPLVK